jgi:hypothetical protein
VDYFPMAATMVAATHLDMAGMVATFFLVAMRIRTTMGIIICTTENTRPTQATHATVLETASVSTTVTHRKATSTSAAIRRLLPLNYGAHQIS